MKAVEPLLSMQPARRRWLGLGGLSVAAALVHLALFSGLDVAWPAHAATLPVQVRVIEPPPEPAPVLAWAEPVVLPAPTARPPEAPPKSKPARPSAAKPRAVPASAASAASEAVHEASSVAGSDALPRYRTQMPPAVTLRYVMERGALRGSGEFVWRPDGDKYELKLEGRVAGLSVLTQVSSGGFDAAGIAPLRFTDQRLRRGTKAANFQRAAGKITFSGPTTEYPLREGSQDRLSWMVQLGAIVAAEPKLRSVGAKVSMYVVGSNGEAGVWTFDCVASEPVPAGTGSGNALKFVREPREAYDTQVQVWIDPARHYLPVRAMQRSGDEVFELRLQPD